MEKISSKAAKAKSDSKGKSSDKLMTQFAPHARDDAIERIVKKDRDPKEFKVDHEKLESIRALKPPFRRFHGVKVPIKWFPWWLWRTKCSNHFGYLAPQSIRQATKLPFNPATIDLLKQLGDFMADVSRGAGGSSIIPAGYTYFGQFVDHDITLDISSDLNTQTDATTIKNMRSPALDLDSLYGLGPAMNPFLYVFPTGGPPTAIKMALGANVVNFPGGPGSGGGFGPMGTPTNRDVPRASGTNTAIIGDPRNDENLIVSQFHHSMLKFHNQVVDGLLDVGFGGDIFLRAKEMVTHHYQWAVVHDFLKRVCGNSAVSSALSTVSAGIDSPFAMPVEFAVAAYRFGHSMVRESYWVTQTHTNLSVSDILGFSKPVQSQFAVDFNAFFDTGFEAAVHNKSSKIDSVLAPGLDLLPGFSGLMAMLASRNLLRGLALSLPSGQGMAQHYGIPALTAAQLTQGLDPGEVSLLQSNGGVLLSKTPLWYYVLREAAVLQGGNQLGPVGGRIVAETFVRMLKRDGDSYLNKAGGFTPGLPAATTGDFTVADLLNLARVTVP